MAPSTAAPTPQPHAKRECPITVAVRIRPPPDAYTLSHHCVQTSPHDPAHQVIVNFDAFADASAAPSSTSASPRAFTFDHVFSPAASQVDVYTACVQPLLDQVVLGYNATALVFGQTGSGKTFTMGTCPLSQMASADDAAQGEGEQEDHDQDEMPPLVGIAPRLVEELIQRLPDVNQRLLRVSYIELYQEELRDLLASDTSPPASDPYSGTTPSSSTLGTTTATPITIREDRNGTIMLSGVSSLPCATATDILTLLDRGSQARTTGETNMNLTSSRSHAIFSIFIEQYILNPSTRQVECRESKLHLVDLAGSERQKRTLADGVRFKESIKINSGLLALGNVINALSAGTPHTGHVPYRDSKLTRLLQDSLGGNSKTVLIACVSPVPGNAQESLNTLVYAHRAKRIKNRPVVNVGGVSTSTHGVPAAVVAAGDHSETVAGTEPEPQRAGQGLGHESAAELLALVDQLKSGLTQANGMIAELHAKTALVPTSLQPPPTSTINQLAPPDSAAKHLAHEIAAYLQSHKPDASRLTTLLAHHGIRLAASPLVRSASTSLDTLPPLPPPGRPASVTGLARKPSTSSLTTGGPPPLRALSHTLSSSSSSTARRATTAPAPDTLTESTHHLLARVVQLESQLSAQSLDLERVGVQARDARATADAKSADLERAERRAKDACEAAGYWERKAAEAGDELVSVRQEAAHASDACDGLKRRVRELEDEVAAVRCVREQQVAPGLEEELVKLTTEMEDKLRMIEELDASRKRTDHLSQKFVDKMVKLERELQGAEKQVERLKSEKLEMDSEKNRVKHEYEIKIQQVSAQLNALRGRQKQHDKLVREKESKQRQIADLQSEVDKLRDRHAQLKSKSRAEADKLASIEAVHLAAVQKLERQHDEDVRRIKVLEGQVVALRKRVDSAASVSSLPSGGGGAKAGVSEERVAEMEAAVTRMRQERDALEEQVRDLEHYRMSNKELRMQLRALMATAAQSEEGGTHHHRHHHRHASKSDEQILAAAIVPLNGQEATRHSRSASEATGGTPTSGAKIRVSKKQLKLMSGMSGMSAAADQYELQVPAGMEVQVIEGRAQMVGL